MRPAGRRPGSWTVTPVSRARARRAPWPRRSCPPGSGGCGTQPPQDGGKGTQPPYRPRTAVAGDACEAGEASQRRTRRGGLAAFGGPGFLDGELGGRIRFQALVGDRLAAADRSAVGAFVKPAQGALDGVQPVAQVLRDGVVLTLLGERQRGVGFVFRLAVHLGLAVPLARRP